MRPGGTKRGPWRGIALVWLALLAGCATPAVRQAHVATPAPCTDSLYLRLKQQHPDSLSERASQRLQSLDRDCATARAESRRDESQRAAGGMMSKGHSGGHWVMMGVGVVMMIAMMFALR